MKKIKLCLLLVCFVLSSCGGGGKPETADSSFVLNLSALTADESIGGGVGVYFLPAGTATDSSVPYFPENVKILDGTNTTEIPYGVWGIYLVGFAGPTAFEPTEGTYCGVLSGVVLDSASAILTVQAEAETCTVRSEMKDLIGAVVVHSKGHQLGIFDQSAFDSVSAFGF